MARGPALGKTADRACARRLRALAVSAIRRRCGQTTGAMTDLRVLILSDGRPGHANLSEGIAAALARRGPVVVTRLLVRRRRIMAGHAAAALIAARIPSAAVLRLAYGLAPAALPAADVIVSAGAETLPGNVCAARLLGVPNVFYGSLRSFHPSWFALTLTSYAAQARDPHPVMTLKPSALDPDTLPPLPAARGRLAARMGLLIGGDSGEVQFAGADWDRLVRLVQSTHQSAGTHWVVSNSRRTPDAVSDRLAVLAAAPQGPIAAFIDVRKPDAGGLVGLLAAVDAVLVTADSSSMLSEAVWARRPALALTPQRCDLTAAERGYRRQLEDAGHCRTIALAEATPQSLAAVLSGLTVLARNPLEDLARLLETHIPTPLGASA
jgi:hypothetical protein